MEFIKRIVRFAKRNPVRVRAAVVAVLSLVGLAVPSLAGIETNEAVVGGIMAVAALVFGFDAARFVDLKPVRREARDQDPAFDAGYEGKHR